MVKQVDLPPVDSIIEEILLWAVRYEDLTEFNK